MLNASFQIANQYAKYSDKELICMLLNKGNEEALLFLIYERYYSDLEFFAYRYFDSIDYLEDLLDELYIHLKGANADWAPLSSFKWKSSFRTWFSSVASHLFLKKRKELIDLGDQSDSIDEKGSAKQISALAATPEKNQKVVMLMEAISRLREEDYRFILIKEIEGYKPKEIAEMLNEKRLQENRMKTRINKETKQVENILANASYIYMIKDRALDEVKSIVEQIKREWYGSKR